MISVEFFTASDGGLTGYQIKGHGGGVAGADIVCASVSSAAYMTANTITEVLHVNASAAVDEDGEMFVRIPKRDIAACRDILAGFKLHMLALEEQYPQNIQVNYTEV